MKSTNSRLARSGLLLAALCLGTSASAEVIVNLDATALPLGPLPEWVNTGTAVGDFTATGSPAVQTISGIKAVTLAGGGDFYAGPVAPSSLAGVNPSRTIEAWVFNPSIAAEETILAWGRRDGPEGTNIAFNYGNNGAFGAIGHWGGPDIGWNNAGGAPVAGIWHYLVYTYDGGGVAASGTTRVYADGVLQNSEFLGNLNTHDGFPFVVGGQNNGAGTPGGFNSGLSIAKIRVHDSALSAAEIAAQFASEKEQFFPQAFLSGTKILSTSKIAFFITDTDSPESVTDPDTFDVTVGGIRAGWQVPGGEGILNGSITTPAISVPGGTVELELQHRYNFEGDEWDGGVVQVSVNDGEFSTLDNANFTQNGYHPVPLIGNHVLTGQLAWNGASAGFAGSTLITSIATIPGLSANDSIRVRFLGAWDEGVTPEGIDWEIGRVTVTAGATTLLDEDFTGGDGGFTGESTAPGGTWAFVEGDLPNLGALTITKEDGVTTICVPINWVPGREYDFTISGKDMLGGDLVYETVLITPTPRLGGPLTWPSAIPGPLGTAGAWGVRTYLNDPIENITDLQGMLTFLSGNAVDRTPTLTPDTVVDTQEPTLNFVDPSTNNPASLWGVIPCSRPFPGDALSTANNGGTARDDNQVITSAHGTIRITEKSDYTFSLRGDDGFMFRITAAAGPNPTFVAVGSSGFVDAAARNILYFPSGTGDTDTRGVVHLTPGIYNLEYATWEGGGGFWYQVAAAKGFFLNSADTNTWAAIGYSTTRTEPVPYPSIVGQWAVDSTLPNATVGSIAAADAAVTAAVTTDPVAARSLVDEINFQDDGGGGSSERIGNSAIFPRMMDGVANDNFALRASATLRIPEDGNYLIGFQGDDGSSLTIGGAHAGFSALTENATGASVIGKANSPVINSGSLGAPGNSLPDTSVFFGRAGALAGSPDPAIGVDTADGNKVEVPFSAALNPFVQDPSIPADVLAPFTVECWAKPATLDGGAQAVVNSMIAGPQQNPGNGNDRSGYVLRRNNGDWQFYLGLDTGGAFYEIATAPAAVLAGEWQHVAGVYTGTEAKLYVNGALITTITTTGPFKKNFGAPMFFGKRGFGDWRFNGDIDEVAVYDTALSDVDIQARYTNGTDAARATPYETLVAASNPVGYWRLNETAGARVDLGTITCNVTTGNSSTVGRIFLTAGDYPISTIWWEGGGGASYEIFAAREIAGGCFPVQTLRSGGWPSIPDSPGLQLIPNPASGPPVVVGDLVINPDGTMSFTFKSRPGETYILEASPDFIDWFELDDNIVATGYLTIVDSERVPTFVYDPNFPEYFYRIRPIQ